MAIFSTISPLPPVNAHPLPPHPSPRQPQLAAGRVWLLTGFLVGPHAPTHIIFHQIPEEKRQIIDKVQERSADDSSVLADGPPPANAAAAQAIHEIEQVLDPQPSTSNSLEKPPNKLSKKVPFVKLIRL